MIAEKLLTKFKEEQFLRPLERIGLHIRAS
jgi:hypothetical protein